MKRTLILTFALLLSIASIGQAQFDVGVVIGDSDAVNNDEITNALTIFLAGPEIASDAPQIIDYNFGAFPAGTPINDFVLRATGFLVVPAAGTYRIGVNSDDGFRLTIAGGTWSGQVNENNNATLGAALEFEDPRGPGDTDGDITFAAPGNYALDLLFYELGGGEEVNLYQLVSGGRVNLGDEAAGALDVVQTIPEPSTIVLAGFGLAGLAVYARRRKVA